MLPLCICGTLRSSSKHRISYYVNHTRDTSFIPARATGEVLPLRQGVDHPHDNLHVEWAATRPTHCRCQRRLVRLLYGVLRNDVGRPDDRVAGAL